MSKKPFDDSPKRKTCTKCDEVVRANGLCQYHNRKSYYKKKGKAYTAWESMRRRCRDPYYRDYHRYGGRGLTICDSWDDFANFLKDMGECPEGLTLERVDNEKGYFPDNCKWATHTEQSRNTCNNVFNEELVKKVRADYASGKYLIIDLSEKYSINRRTMRDVIRNRRWKNV